MAKENKFRDAEQGILRFLESDDITREGLIHSINQLTPHLEEIQQALNLAAFIGDNLTEFRALVEAGEKAYGADPYNTNWRKFIDKVANIRPLLKEMIGRFGG